MRQTNSDRRIERVVREDAEQEERKGILEIFPRDEDEPLSRDADDDQDDEQRRPGRAPGADWAAPPRRTRGFAARPFPVASAVQGAR